jgi:hypothetical protein
MMCKVFIWVLYGCLVVICAVAYVFGGGSLTEPGEVCFGGKISMLSHRIYSCGLRDRY